MITPELDIVVPVYNEGAGIRRLLESLRKHVKTSIRVIICYDSADDDTLPAVAEYPHKEIDIVPVKNSGAGPADAVISGLKCTTAPAVLICPADDDYSAIRIDEMMDLLRSGCDVVCADRFSIRGNVTGYPLIKTLLVRTAGLLLYYLARFPTKDPTNGLRLFSGRVVRTIPIETRIGHAYSIELLVKCHRIGWKIGDIPAEWHERTHGKSRFRVLRWLPVYLRWFIFAFATTYLHRHPGPIK